MAIKWMGRYRDFVSAVVKHSNQYNRVANVDSVSFEDKTFSSIEWQILEYVYEHPDDTGNMSVISEALGLAASSFSKSTAKLVRLGPLRSSTAWTTSNWPLSFLQYPRSGISPKHRRRKKPLRKNSSVSNNIRAAARMGSQLVGRDGL